MIADTSFLVAIFIPEDDLHKRAIKLAKEISGEIIIPFNVLEETFTVITYKKGVLFALQTMEKLEKNERIYFYRLEEDEWSSIKQLIRRFQRKMSFVDYIVVYLSLKNRERVLCFDRQILQLVKRWVKH